MIPEIESKFVAIILPWVMQMLIQLCSWFQWLNPHQQSRTKFEFLIVLKGIIQFCYWSQITHFFQCGLDFPKDVMSHNWDLGYASFPSYKMMSLSFSFVMIFQPLCQMIQIISFFDHVILHW